VAFSDGVDEWARLLTRKFSQPTNIIIDAMIYEKYTIKDTANHREPVEFGTKMLRYAKDTGLKEVRV